MGIISRSRAQNRQRAGTTVIAAGTKLVGDLALSDNLHVDGRLEGSIRCEGEVSIGQQGQVEGEISADHILVSGKFDGTIDAQRLEIAAGGHVNGDVTVGELVIESGAQFNGASHTRKQEAPRQLGHIKEDSAATGNKMATGKNGKSEPGDHAPSASKTSPPPEPQP